MSTVQTTFPRPLGHRHAVAGWGGVPSAPQRRSGARGLAALLLAAVVASLVVIADRLISTWADGHLLLAWVVLWAVVFAGMALFADVARRAAGSLLVRLDQWSRVQAERRADARLWAMARQDPRLMRELEAARQRNDGGSFDEALAPLGMEGPVAKARPAPAPRTAEAMERLARRASGRALF